MINCDMCGIKIEDGKCDCGTWHSAEEMKDNPMKKALEHFHEMKRFSLTSDMPHLGVAVLFFRGDVNDCVKLQDYLCAFKGRPHYKED